MTAYIRQRYLLMTHDPVHIGTGGYRLGRVDNSIVREPGTRVPKIPGTSLHGAARAYAARLYETPEAAGQSHENVADPQRNPVCYTFGYIQKSGEEENESVTAYSGTVNIFDAQILFFPVHTRTGPAWVSTLRRLDEAGYDVKLPKPEDAGDDVGQLPKLLETWAMEQVLTTWKQDQPLNLGWLLLQAGEIVEVTPRDANWQCKEWDQIAGRIALVHEEIFSQVVNSNLEVRTSVSINPETGAAKDGALYTYEAIPRATFLTVDVVLDDYRNNQIRVATSDSVATESVFPAEGFTQTGGETPQSLPHGPWKDPLDVVKAGFELMKWLGVGGMGTRGFGRLAIVAKSIPENFATASQPKETTP